jgi:hypothetical protein
MKKVKKIIVFSDGSCYVDLHVISTIKLNNVIFKKIDYKNSSLYDKKQKKNYISKYSKKYKKKFF